jgi:hypothetical protein
VANRTDDALFQPVLYWKLEEKVITESATAVELRLSNHFEITLHR